MVEVLASIEIVDGTGRVFPSPSRSPLLPFRLSLSFEQQIVKGGIKRVGPLETPCVWCLVGDSTQRVGCRSVNPI